MEGPQPGESPDNEYMAMDPDQWEDQDDTYENGDTLVNDIGRREVVPVPGGATQPANMASRQTNDTHNRPQINSLPLPSRYMTIRWPPPNGNRGSEKPKKLVFFQRTTMGLALLCLLLLAVVLGLSIAYNILAGLHYQQSCMLLNANQKLHEGIGLLCGAKSNISNENQTSGSELYAKNCDVFKENTSQESFFLYYTEGKNDSCKNLNCEC